ncbi:Uncharacterized protein TCM_027554 [Theobroma cacao]|uniref:Uncharacterized protein n=1 Tax=Theobroma cacao TaxID=3641 RepID=A0A061G9B3_THECC|nr:Uncharacterized protein TCM_027554 [Theobroma cacao]
MEFREYDNLKSSFVVARENWAFNNIIVHQINEPESQKHELWFAIRKTKAWFSKQEFYLVTGLKFDPLLDIFL